jgi:SPP1 family predicted phage head-tail adaptor
VTAGALRRRLILERPIETSDGGGGVVTAWEEVARLPAAVAALDAEEAIVAGRRDGFVTQRVVIRHRGDVVGGMRFIDGAAVLRIVATYDPEGRRRSLVCLCEEDGR